MAIPNLTFCVNRINTVNYRIAIHAYGLVCGHGNNMPLSHMICHVTRVTSIESCYIETPYNLLSY